MIKQTLPLLILVFVIQSCDCQIITRGTVIDSVTKKPIEKAELHYLNVRSTDFVTNQKRVFTTDSIGHYNMHSNNYGFCPDIDVKLKVCKQGYQCKEVTLSENASDTIELVKL